MTRKSAIKNEKILRSRGVYKPYVSTDGDTLFVESYPLTVIITDGPCDPEMGPVQYLKLTDCTLPRIGQDAVLTTDRVFAGQNLLTRVAQMLVDYHEPAYARAKQQDAYSSSKLAVDREVGETEVEVVA